MEDDGTENDHEKTGEFVFVEDEARAKGNGRVAFSKYGVFSGLYSVRMWENTDQKKFRIWTLSRCEDLSFLRK